MLKNVATLWLILVLSTLSAYAQKTTVRFCQVSVRAGVLSSLTVRIQVFTGQVDSLHSDSIKSNLLEVKKAAALSTVPDMLDYVYSLGWVLVWEDAVPNHRNFYFKKAFIEPESK